MTAIELLRTPKYSPARIPFSDAPEKVDIWIVKEAELQATTDLKQQEFSQAG